MSKKGGRKTFRCVFFSACLLDVGQNRSFCLEAAVKMIEHDLLSVVYVII